MWKIKLLILFYDIMYKILSDIVIFLNSFNSKEYISFLIIQIHYRLLIESVFEEKRVNWDESDLYSDIACMLIDYVNYIQ